MTGVQTCALPIYVGAESALAARGLFAAIEVCDAEIQIHDRDASATEIERLGARLAALEADAAADSAARQELLSLVRRELDLVRQMRAAGEVISQRRARLFNLMRGLWTQLGAVLDGTADGLAPLIRVTDRVRALCAEIGDELRQEDPASSRLSQARAVAHSRLTVAGDTSSASAVSSMLNPPK